MTMERRQFIQQLAADPQPIQRPGRTLGPALVWLAATLVAVVAVMVVRQPMRPGFVEQLQQSAQLLIESSLGVAVIVVVGLAALRMGIPAVPRLAWRVGPPLALLVLWIGVNGYGLVHPALPPSTLGERAHCYLEVMVAGMPGLLLGLWFARRLYHLHPAWSGLLIGLAAGVTAALVMQFACMYVPIHNLAFHLLPGLLLGVVGWAIGRRWLSPR